MGGCKKTHSAYLLITSCSFSPFQTDFPGHYYLVILYNQYSHYIAIVKITQTG